MTPSEEVRKLLDERGVEYDAVDKDGAHFTWWDLNGVRYEYTYYDGCKFGNLSISCANFLTPAQAIAASVGAGTCHIEERHGDWYCTECGEMVGTCDLASELCIDGNEIELWCHCPNCGRRIEVDE